MLVPAAADQHNPSVVEVEVRLEVPPPMPPRRWRRRRKRRRRSQTTTWCVPSGSLTFSLPIICSGLRSFRLIYSSRIAVLLAGYKCICTHPTRFRLFAISSSRTRSLVNDRFGRRRVLEQSSIQDPGSTWFLVYNALFVVSFAANLLFSLSWELALYSTQPQKRDSLTWTASI